MTHLRAQVSPAVDLGIFVAVVALAGWWMTWFGVLVTAGLAFLMLNGFVVDQYAVLLWHGSDDVVRISLLVGCAIVAAGARQLKLRHRRRVADTRFTPELAEIARTTSPTPGGPRHA
jgi:hypothetical protein